MSDGNCLYLALSVGLNGEESRHFKLRQYTARHFSAKFQVRLLTSTAWERSQAVDVSSLTATDKALICQRARVLVTDKVEVSEEAIHVLADLLQRNVMSLRHLPSSPTPSINIQASARMFGGGAQLMYTSS